MLKSLLSYRALKIALEQTDLPLLRFPLAREQRERPGLCLPGEWKYDVMTDNHDPPKPSDADAEPAVSGTCQGCSGRMRGTQRSFGAKLHRWQGATSPSTAVAEKNVTRRLCFAGSRMYAWVGRWHRHGRRKGMDCGSRDTSPECCCIPPWGAQASSGGGGQLK